MTTQTMLTSLGAVLLLTMIAFAMYALSGQPGIPNTGIELSNTNDGLYRPADDSSE